MIATCPICSKKFEFTSFDDQPAFPFCTDRCKLIDLGRWIDGDYAIPGDARTDEDQAVPGPPADPSEEDLDG